MLRRGNRFHGLGSLKRVYQNGRSTRTGALALKVLHNDRRRVFRVSVVVSRKVSKSAVVRNRLRRRVYEQVRLRAAEITQPYDMVFTVYHEQLEELPPSKLARLVDNLLRQAGVIGR